MIGTAYPDAPGYKVGGTSKEAARAIRSTAEKLRIRCIDVIRRKPSTADEVAEALGESVLSVRPRITELGAKGMIRKTGLRRRNASGMSATVWGAA